MRDADLTEAEIARLTGKVYPKVQAKVLTKRGWYAAEQERLRQSRYRSPSISCRQIGDSFICN